MSETSWIHRWKNSKPTSPQSKGSRTMNASEEIVWIRKNVLAKGPNDNPAYEEAAKRLSELYATNYPGEEEDNAR
jgi:hypothetical protein